MLPRVLLHYSPHGRAAPGLVHAFAAGSGHTLLEVATAADLWRRAAHSHAVALVFDASHPADGVLKVCRDVKAEPFTSVFPVIMYVDAQAAHAESASDALAAGADEVLSPTLSERECELRLERALHRADRDVGVHPTTLLPGTVQIERDIALRLASGEKFAVCYADLDHFKEFNDRYGYNHGDRVILILSRILREVVRARSDRAFVGHIGGDDFIFNAPLEDFRACCEEVLSVFNELIPLQYSEEDRARGFFLGKDRRGHEHEVPLMTLSIGVVTNEQRHFTHTAQISELATEMKSYAKSFAGSIYVVDRRADDVQLD
jgi:diguanylate cyclase (GGDEF)-like protein